jgi:hypothetical protein
VKPHLEPAQRRSFVTWDLEWIPALNPQRSKALGFEPLELRLAGVFDGSNYRAYTSIADFLDGELIPANAGKWYYAHAGGLFDLTFVLHHILEHCPGDYVIEAAFSGSAAIITKFRKGRHTWTFCDSFWLLRDSLRNIGKWLGLEKGGAEGSADVFYAPLNVLMDYNERDCRILHRAIAMFEEVVLDLGGQLEKTVASTALKLFRMAYLKRGIQVRNDVNTSARLAYVASRVEVFQKQVRDANYYDINSSFPYAMTHVMPGNYKGSSRRLQESELFLADVTLEVPESEVPPLPFRTRSGRIFFPWGTWRGWICNPDLELLADCGGRILRVHHCKTFHPFGDLQDYAQDIYERRMNATDDAWKQILKILLNSLYGKFAESERKGKIVVNPSDRLMARPDALPGGSGKRYVMPGVYEFIEDRRVPHAHVPLSMHITAIARSVLTRYMRTASVVYYCDTDGFACDSADVFPTGKELGKLKLEKVIESGHFEAPKLYAYKAQDAKDYTVKAKGFSRILNPDDETEDAHRISYADFQKLLEGRELHVQQFARIKSNLRDDNAHPRELTVRKHYLGKVTPKRAEIGGGTTRPWHVSELESVK